MPGSASVDFLTPLTSLTTCGKSLVDQSFNFQSRNNFAVSTLVLVPTIAGTFGKWYFPVDLVINVSHRSSHLDMGSISDVRRSTEANVLEDDKLPSEGIAQIGFQLDTDLRPVPTPLPKLQLFILFYIQLAEPIASTVIYPFVNQLVRQTGVTKGDERKTGYFAGKNHFVDRAEKSAAYPSFSPAQDSS